MATVIACFMLCKLESVGVDWIRERRAVVSTPPERRMADVGGRLEREEMRRMRRRVG